MSIKGFLLTWGFTSKPREERQSTHRRAETIADQDQVFGYFNGIGITNGTPGTLSDSAVRAGVHEVVNGNYTASQKYEMLDALTFAVYNNHERGMAADVLDDISRAIDKVQGF